MIMLKKCIQGYKTEAVLRKTDLCYDIIELRKTDYHLLDSQSLYDKNNSYYMPISINRKPY